MATVIPAIISVTLGIVAIAGGCFVSIIHTIIGGIILYYLYRPNVKAYFGRLTRLNNFPDVIILSYLTTAIPSYADHFKLPIIFWTIGKYMSKNSGVEK